MLVLRPGQEATQQPPPPLQGWIWPEDWQAEIVALRAGLVRGMLALHWKRRSSMRRLGNAAPDPSVA